MDARKLFDIGLKYMPIGWGIVPAKLQRIAISYWRSAMNIVTDLTGKCCCSEWCRPAG